MSNLIIPTFKTGYATSPGESRAPDLWTGLKAAWLPFLGATGLELRDCSGHGNHGVLVGMDPATDWVVDQSYALDFDGTDYINCGAGTSLNITGLGLTIAGWFYLTDPTDYQDFVAKGNPSPVAPYHHYSLTRDPTSDALQFAADIGGTLRILVRQGAAYQQVNEWAHVAATYDGVISNLYINGKLDATDNTYSGSIGSHPTWPLFIGALAYLGTSYKGMISQVEVWDRGLSANEVAQLSSEPYPMWQLAIRPQMKAPGDIVQLTATSAAVTATTATLTIGVTESMTATAAAVVSTTATLTKAGIVDMTATAAAVVSTTASLSKGERVNMTATAAAVTSTTASLTVGVTESMTATAAAVTSATAKLTFVGEKDFFLDIPIHTLSIDNSTQILKPFTNAIPIDHGLTIDNTTGVIKVETNAIPIHSLSSDAARVLPRTNPGAVLLYTGVYNDFTAEARDNTPDDVDLSQGAGTILYIGYKEKFYAVRIIVSTAGVGSYTMEAAKYWNGAAWVTLAYSDGELNDFKTAETIHIAGLPNDPDDWAKTTVNGSELYWISMETLSGTQSQKPLAQRISLQIVGVVASYRFITFSSEQVYQEFF